MVINFNNTRNEEYKQKVTQIFDIALKEVNVINDISVNITFVGEKKIRQLNNEFRQVDKVTDVLSFPLFEADENKQGDIGDIVICTKRANEQAKQYGHSELRELCFLSLHGLLHVLGFDHIQKQDEEVMFSLQDKILKKAQMER